MVRVSRGRVEADLDAFLAFHVDVRIRMSSRVSVETFSLAPDTEFWDYLQILEVRVFYFRVDNIMSMTLYSNYA